MSKWKARFEIYATTTVEADTEAEAMNLAIQDMNNDFLTIKEYDVKVEPLE